MALAEAARDTKLQNSPDEDQFRNGRTCEGPHAVCESAQQPGCNEPKPAASVPGWILIWTFLSTPVIVFLLTHTALGFGHKLYSKLAQHYDIAYYMGAALLLRAPKLACLFCSQCHVAHAT
ncbi:hypothetical protein CYMTET_41345 [Cymbomonas tetramitiformis]|uniref:Uncharacterized protein n=1 Tax=Cymbomonas tetramitiformis TaxID=36881 RepID=A0AAE0F2C4_9CHLO|nr:hypothetical protein CYMTET_41345 [Cymbomonas tetramitiformis]